ncbi:MAG: undecaprenyldiphospho-muramoylpentapeptide beta-N-acetylglucosaminyltransferase [Lactobacillaceae bacterium]|jgi:UDP-N-acetylglucosamine--N-acetylmuramyl-(pentapeptide) pyrophosphoryl-undecaprenol N-acetylglucosamine transferase|nr:undecaprenyldiphospho-muramoylpentapeptide beta-N-acetylglucosaminyltransferase [Lactobacillaceae bacterium]
MKVILSGGGTGGHIYPALALAKTILKNDPDSQILYVGANRGVETSIVPKAGIEFVGLDLQGLSRSNPLSNFKTLAMLNNAIKKAKKLIDDFQPDVVVGTGGYASSAMLLAAQSKKVPTVIHEQNLTPGLTNTWLAKRATAVAVSFKATLKSFPQDKVHYTGNPRGQEILEDTRKAKYSDYGLKSSKKTILIFGGSQGAYRLNQAFVNTATRFQNLKGIQTILVTGPKYFDSVKLQLDEELKGDLSNIAIFPYIDDMAPLLKISDLLVARSGATTLAEITAIGIASILIPSPNVTANQQEVNARILEENNAAVVMTENEMTPEKFFHDIKAVIEDKDELKAIAENAKLSGQPDASDQLYQLVKQIIINNKNA